MNPFARLFLKTLPEAPADKLAATLKPRPDLRDRRFAKWSMDRRERYLAAAFGEPISLQRRGGQLTVVASDLRVSDVSNSSDTRLCNTGAGASAAKEGGTGLQPRPTGPERCASPGGLSVISPPMLQPERI